MKALYLDCFAGISGSMLLGAFLDAGLPEEILRQQLSSLPINGYTLRINKVVKSGIYATFVAIECDHNDPKDVTHRYLSDILDMIDHSLFTKIVKENSKKIFLILAQAKAKISGIGMDNVDFGASDAIVTIIGTALGLHYLGIEAIYTSKLQVGNGFVQKFDGCMPIPTPVTAQLLNNIPYYNGNINEELVTQTGAAIIAALGTEYGDRPEHFISQSIAYGAGSLDLPIPNILRLHIGEIASPAITANDTMVIEANIDDLSPQIFPYVMEKLLTLGVYDVWLTPIIMKKNRCATTLSVLVNRSLFDQVISILFKETSTIGLRYYKVERKMALRELIKITVPLGQAHVKISSYDGKICSITPEYEDCKVLAIKNGIALKKVQQIVLEAAQKYI